MGLSHTSIYHSSHVRSVMTSGPVIVEPFSDLYPRLDIWDFYGNETYKPQFAKEAKRIALQYQANEMKKIFLTPEIEMNTPQGKNKVKIR
ncbi:4348_t:CDS:2 [Gigaspora rosea]|nr:4348_t:CDS:2 [Gigaspora rosea]